MKLLLYASAWAPSIGGVEIISGALARGLTNLPTQGSTGTTADPIEVTVLTETPAGSMDDSQFSFRVVRRPGLGGWLRELRIADVVELEGPSLLPQFLAWLMRKPLVLQHHGYQAVCPNGLLIFEPDKSLCPGHFMARCYGKCVECNAKNLGTAGSLRSLLFTFPRRWLARRATANVGVSSHVAQRIDLPRTHVIWNGVPDVSGAPSPDPSGDAQATPVRFVFLGRLVAEKGVAVLLRACAEIKPQISPFSVTIIGDGPERENLETLTRELKLSNLVNFTGSLRGPDLAKALADAVVVMPSIWEDVSPLVAIEQMIAGRLVIASDIGGLGEMIADAGLKFPAGDSAALAARLREVLANPGLARTLGAKARERALEHFTESRLVEEHAQLYRMLAAGPR